MTEEEKAAAGMLYDAGDITLIKKRARASDLCMDYNALRSSQRTGKIKILTELLGTSWEESVIEAPFFCDYGFNIHLGRNFYANRGLIVLDCASVTFGDNVFLAPNCCLTTAGHPLDAERRNKGLEFALPIHIGDNVWLGAGVQVLPGVTIGSGSVIGAGSVVNRDIPEGVVAVGAPCKVVRKI